MNDEENRISKKVLANAFPFSERVLREPVFELENVKKLFWEVKNFIFVSHLGYKNRKCYAKFENVNLFSWQNAQKILKLHTDGKQFVLVL